MVVELNLTCCHISEDVMHYRNPLETVIIEERALVLQIFELLQCVFDLSLFHEGQPKVIFSFEVFFNKLLL